MAVAKLPVIVRRWDTLDYVPVSVGAAAILDEQPVYIALTPVDSEADPDWKVATWEGAADSVREARILVGPLGAVELDPVVHYVVSVWIDDTATQVKMNAYELWPTRIGADSTETFSTPSVNVQLPLDQSQVSGLSGDLAALRLADTNFTTDLADETTARLILADKIDQIFVSSMTSLLDPAFGGDITDANFDWGDALDLATTAITAKGGGVIWVPAGNYKFSGKHIIPASCGIWGEGQNGTTTFLCLDAAASIQLGPDAGGGYRRGRTGGFDVNALGVANYPLVVALGANYAIDDIQISNAVVAGLSFIAAQNITADNIQLQGNHIGTLFEAGSKNIILGPGTSNNNDIGVKMSSEIPNPGGDEHHSECANIRIWGRLIEAEQVVGAISYLFNSGKDVVIIDGAANADACAFHFELIEARPLSAPSLRQISIRGTKGAGGAVAGSTWIRMLSALLVTVTGEATAEGFDIQYDLRHSGARVDYAQSMPLSTALANRFVTTTGYTYGQMVSKFGKFELVSTDTLASTDHTTYITDAQLTCRGLGVNSKWFFEGIIVYDGPVNANFQLRPDFPIDATVVWFALGNDAQSDSVLLGSLTQPKHVLTDFPAMAGTVAPQFTTTAGVSKAVRVSGFVTTVSNTDVGFKFRKGFATGTDVHRLPSSYVNWHRLDP